MDTLTHGPFYAKTLLHTDVFIHRRLRWTRQNRNLPQFLLIEPRFVRKGCDGTVKIAISPQFLTIEPHFVRKGCDGRLKIAILPQFLTIEPHFLQKGCVSWRLVGTAPRLKREIEKKEREEGKRARGQEGKRATERRCEKM